MGPLPAIRDGAPDACQGPDPDGEGSGDAGPGRCADEGIHPAGSDAGVELPAGMHGPLAGHSAGFTDHLQ